MIKNYCKTILFLLLLSNAVQSKGQEIVSGSSASLQSPDKNYTVHFYQKQNGAGEKACYYTITYKNKNVILESRLDLNLDNHLSEKAMALSVDNHKDWCENLKVNSIKYLDHDSHWKPICGERSDIRDHYNAATIALVKDDNSIYLMNIEIRAYDEGVAVRYFFPENVKGTYYNIIQENTEFSVPAGTQAWVTNWAQGPYAKLPLQAWADESERPLTLELSNGLYACLAEAQMVDYTRTKFKLSETKPNTIQTSLFAGGAQLISPFGTPWRVVMAAERPGDLIEHNYLLLNLNEPNKIPNPGWIKPGKQIRVMNQTTLDAKANIDFAAQHNLQYVLFDWKWYGPPFSFESDATKVALPGLDLPGIVSYAKEKGVGVWLYINQQAALAQSDSLFSVYKKWGIKGVKIGFVQVGSHRWTTWLEKTIQQAAASQIMLDIHDDWRPTGEQRTWPNLLSAEGIRGNEEFPDATHNTILPFTRYIAGPADYTICYFDKRIKTTHAHQLALAAIDFSPIQTLYWYDKPSAYHNEPELEFWDKIPTTWDETVIVQGFPGEYITTARRKGSAWFVGTITNNNSRKLTIPLKFLENNKKYKATIYTDDPSVATTTHVKVENKAVSSVSILNVDLLPSGGQAIYIEEVD